jgi:hypothetical protein
MTFPIADSIHRLAKEAFDSGEAASLAEAEAILARRRIGVTIEAAEALEPCHQASLLTVVALARRVFLGGVAVSGSVDVPTAVPGFHSPTLRETIEELGGSIAGTGIAAPEIAIGGGPRPQSEGFHVRTACAGWRGGILPAHYLGRPVGVAAMPLAGVMAAALAVNEAFMFARRESAVAGRRAVGFSLWSPWSTEDWLTEEEAPDLLFLPSRLWLIGLGHLGQAYLWALGLLPYANACDLKLVLQDVDIVTPSTESTSILTDQRMLGRKKTRVTADWAEQRGFATTVHERRFANDFRRNDDEPAIALCGLDNAFGRRALEKVGFDLVVESGLGRGYRDFRTMRLHTLPGNRPAVDIWSNQDRADTVELQPAYQAMLDEGVLDQCGVTLLAGKAVGAPFVGCVAACLALSEILRLLHGGHLSELIAVDLQAVEHRIIIPKSVDFGHLNPGFVRARASRTSERDSGTTPQTLFSQSI